MKIMILVNKDFEYAGYISGVETRMTAGATPHLHIVSQNRDTVNGRFSPLCLYELETSTGEKHTISEYCINNFFEDGKKSSNSQIKYGLLMDFFGKLKLENNLPDYIISVSTSESTKYSQGVSLKDNPVMEEKSVNGCVYMGNKFFAHDCRDIDKPPRQSELIVDEYLDNQPIFKDFYLCVKNHQTELTKGMIALPNRPASKLECIANLEDTSLGVVNITNYERYPDADKATSDAFDKYNMEIKSGRLNPVGLETTHAVVKKAVKGLMIPVLFVSPIVDRYLCFNSDVVGNWGEQNRKGSYNAGVVVANMLECFRDKFPKNFKEEE